MDEQTARSLNAINRAFYSDYAAEFDESRTAPWPGWTRLLSSIRRTSTASSKGAFRILDVGCGNGRFGAFLADPLVADEVHYCGIDSSAELIARAQARALPFAAVEFQQRDLVEGEDHLPNGPFSLIALFGVLHHVPGRERRRRLLRGLGARLAPNGILALATWQFEAFERFRSRLTPWPEYNRTASDPIDTAQLEPGDHLLPWGESGATHRYCHFASEDETRELLKDLSFEIVDSYVSDGREGNLNRYFICRSSDAQLAPKKGGARSAAAI